MKRKIKEKCWEPLKELHKRNIIKVIEDISNNKISKEETIKRINIINESKGEQWKQKILEGSAIIKEEKIKYATFLGSDTSFLPSTDIDKLFFIQDINDGNMLGYILIEDKQNWNINSMPQIEYITKFLKDNIKPSLLILSINNKFIEKSKNKIKILQLNEDCKPYKVIDIKNNCDFIIRNKLASKYTTNSIINYFSLICIKNKYNEIDENDIELILDKYNDVSIPGF